MICAVIRMTNMLQEGLSGNAQFAPGIRYLLRKQAPVARMPVKGIMCQGDAHGQTP